MRRPSKYIVIRLHGLFGYAEYLGPVVSRPEDVELDVSRLYGRPGHVLNWIAWSKATSRQRQETLRAYDERGGPGSHEG